MYNGDYTSVKLLTSSDNFDGGYNSYYVQLKIDTVESGNDTVQLSIFKVGNSVDELSSDIYGLAPCFETTVNVAQGGTANYFGSRILRSTTQDSIPSFGAVTLTRMKTLSDDAFKPTTEPTKPTTQPVTETTTEPTTQPDKSDNNCSCICHNQNGFMGFIYKIILFFWKILGINKTCACGVAHY